MDKQSKTQKQKVLRRSSVLESLKDLGDSGTKSLQNDLLKETSSEFFGQLFGTNAQKKYSGEIEPGESVELSEVYAGKAEENKKLKHQLQLERKLREEERVLMQSRSNELRVNLHALTSEVAKMAQATQELDQSVKIAAIQAPANPGVYHLVFFEKLLEYIRSFRKNLRDASVWLNAVNKRAQKKGFWGSYQKHGGKFLLSPDHYLQRSAG